MTKKGEQVFLEEIMKNEDVVSRDKRKIETMAKENGIPLWEAQGISSFYLQKPSKVKVCVGLPCSMSSNHNGKAMSEFLDGEHESVSCLGYCDHSPVIWKNGKYFEVKDKPVQISQSARSNSSNTTDNISAYSNGFHVLKKVFEEQNKASVIELIHDWALRGMGGAGFPTYVKWKAVTATDPANRYLIVNAHEGEPGTFKDRVIMETRPFELIEAAIVTANIIGAKHVIIALKWEYLNSEFILKKALSASLAHLKKTMPDLSPPEIRIMRIPGFYVTGEETALIEAIEGKRSEPRLRPPFPAEYGLYGKPTLIDNVETLVYLLNLLQHHYNNDGKSTDKKAYCLTGDVSRPGAYFENYGIKARDLVEHSGRTSPQNIKAFLPGGLSGGILSSKFLDTELEFDAVRATGAGLGTGSMIAISKDRCMVDVLGKIEDFFARESCGKCIPCRVGTQELKSVLTRLQEGSASMEDLKTAENDARTMISGSICGLGQAAGRMFLDGLKHFKEEIEDHTKSKCPTKVCFNGVS